MRDNGATLDLVIQNPMNLMALIHVVRKNIQEPEFQEGSMFCYKLMKFKMKLAFESWNKRIKLSELIWRALFKTIVQRQSIAANALQVFLQKEHNIQTGLFDKIFDLDGLLVEPSEE